MMKMLLTGAAALGFFSTAALMSEASARTVCNDHGRCWTENGHGRSAYRGHDWRREYHNRNHEGPHAPHTFHHFKHYDR